MAEAHPSQLKLAGVCTVLGNHLLKVVASNDNGDFS